MTKTFKTAAAQLSLVFLDKAKTVKKACSAILEAGENGAKLIVFLTSMNLKNSIRREGSGSTPAIVALYHQTDK